MEHAPLLSVGAVVSTAVTILLVSVAIHFGAKPFAKKKDEKFRNAVLVAVVGSLLAGLVWIGLGQLTGETIARVVALAAWALVASAVYRTSWVKGALIGFVAWLLWFLVGLLIGLVLPS